MVFDSILLAWLTEINCEDFLFCAVSHYADGVKNITAYRAISVAASTRCSGHFLACPS